MVKRIFISSPSNKSLDDGRRALKGAIVDKLVASGFAPQEFWESGLAENQAWSFDSVDKIMQQCVGAVVVGFPRWTFAEPSSETRLLGDYNHYEGAVALTHGLPLLILAESGVENRGIVWTGGGRTITYVPVDADSAWVNHPDFTKRFDAWRREVESRRDIFFGYCSKSAPLPAQIQLRLTAAGATVLHWEMDFR